MKCRNVSVCLPLALFLCPLLAPCFYLNNVLLARCLSSKHNRPFLIINSSVFLRLTETQLRRPHARTNQGGSTLICRAKMFPRKTSVSRKENRRCFIQDTMVGIFSVSSCLMGYMTGTLLKPPVKAFPLIICSAQEEQKDCVHFLVSESRLLSNFNLRSISNYLDALYDKRWTLFSFCGIVFLYFF